MASIPALADLWEEGGEERERERGDGEKERKWMRYGEERNRSVIK